MVRRERGAAEEGREPLVELEHRRVPILRLLRHRMLDDELEALRDPRVDLARPHRLLREDQREGRRRIVALERALAGDHEVEAGAHRVDVRPRIDLLTARLLRGHVARRAHDHAGARERVARASLADPEIDHLHLERARRSALDLRNRRREDEDVLRLHVAVDHAARVRRGERLAHLAPDLRGEPRLEGALAPDVVGELLALEVLADEVRRAVGEMMHVEDVDDVRMLDRARDRRLAEEPRGHLRVLGELGVERLHREAALLEAEVTRLVDAPHAALADRPDDLVRVAEERADPRIGSGLVVAHERRRIPRTDEKVRRIALVARGAATGQLRGHRHRRGSLLQVRRARRRKARRTRGRP